MKTLTDIAIKELLDTQKIAALGTLSHQKEPFVSMVPFALDLVTGNFLIHVSKLAAHTQWMLENEKVSLMVVASYMVNKLPQEVPRLTIQGTATTINKNSSAYESARTIYIQRFPESTELFSFSDFFLFKIKPATIRWIAGFAQAKTIPAEDFFRLFSLQ